MNKYPNTLVIVSALTFFFFGYLGLDYGDNAHEGVIIDAIVKSANTKSFIVDFYLYPHFLINLIILLNTLKILISYDFNLVLFAKNLATGEFFDYFSANLLNDNFLIFIRSFLLTLVILSSYFYIRLSNLITNNYALGCLAAIIPLNSFTILYHSRWIQPDLIVFLISPIILFFFINFFNKKKARDLYILSVLVGLSISAKYTAGVFVLYPIISSLISKKKIKNLFISCLIIILTIYMVMPNVYLNLPRLLNAFNYEYNHYFKLGHIENTVTNGLQHIYLIIQFVSLKLLASNEFVSFLIFILCFFGMIIFFKKDKILSLLLVLPYIFYFTVFINTQVGFVRNYLFFLPLMIVYFSFFLRYFFSDSNKIPKKWPIVYFFYFILVASFVSKNYPIFYFQNYEKNKINKNSRYLLLDEMNLSKKKINLHLHDYLSKNKNKIFYLSNHSIKYFENNESIKNITRDITKSTDIIYVMGEEHYNVRANKLNSINIVYGVNDYDVSYYPFQGGMTVKILTTSRNNFFDITINKNEN